MDMRSLPVSQARESLAEVITELESGPVEITRHGVAIAYMVNPTMFHKLSNPPTGHVFSTDDVSPATRNVDELLALKPLTPERDGPTLSEILQEQRADER